MEFSLYKKTRPRLIFSKRPVTFKMLLDALASFTNINLKRLTQELSMVKKIAC